MRTPICDRLGIEFPIFAFTHCRDVVAAVSNAGGFGVLGAVGFSPEQLAIELDWIDSHVGDNPYGVDLVIPQRYEGMGELDPEKLEAQLRAAIPTQHREFAAKLLADHGVPELPEEEKHHELLGMSLATATPQLDVALEHDKVNARSPTRSERRRPEVVERVQASGRLVGALCGKVHQADAAQGEPSARLHHRPGHRGRRPHRRDRQHGAVAADHQSRLRPCPCSPPGGIGDGAQIAAALAIGAAGRLDGIAVADRGGGRVPASADGLVPRTRPARTPCARDPSPASPAAC